MTDSRLLMLLHLCDSLFPLGSFAHSDGLEAVTADGRIADTGDLRTWLAASRDENLRRCEGPAVRASWRLSAELPQTVAALSALDAELHALRPSSSSRQASRAMGARLVTTWRRIHPSVRADTLPGALTLPVAFGAVGAVEGIAERATIEGFCYTRLAATVSAAMRLMAIGQQQAHGLLAEVLEGVPPLVDALLASDDPPAAFMPGFDLAAMSQQYLRSRLFRS